MSTTLDEIERSLDCILEPEKHLREPFFAISTILFYLTHQPTSKNLLLEDDQEAGERVADKINRALPIALANLRAQLEQDAIKAVLNLREAAKTTAQEEDEKAP